MMYLILFVIWAIGTFLAIKYVRSGALDKWSEKAEKQIQAKIKDKKPDQPEQPPQPPNQAPTAT
jgi:hypothetical protein